MSKNLYLCVPDPFDSSTGARLERMGILRPDGEVNVEEVGGQAVLGRQAL